MHQTIETLTHEESGLSKKAYETMVHNEALFTVKTAWENSRSTIHFAFYTPHDAAKVEHAIMAKGGGSKNLLRMIKSTKNWRQLTRRSFAMEAEGFEDMSRAAIIRAAQLLKAV